MRRLFLITSIFLSMSMMFAHRVFAQVAFDRPGIAFSTSTLPAGTVSWEQGLPDWSRERSEFAFFNPESMQLTSTNIELTSYGTSTLIRVGLNQRMELQLGGSPYNRVRFSADLADSRSFSSGGSESSGAGDVSAALKYAMPTSPAGREWAFLAKVSVPTGNFGFRDDRTQWDVGTSASWALSDASSLGLYGNVGLDSETYDWTISPSLSFTLSESLAAFVEAGVSKSEFGSSATVAGGGLTAMPLDNLQLDVSVLWGVNDEAIDITAGLGFSIFFGH